METAVEFLTNVFFKSRVEKALFQDEIHQAKEMEHLQKKILNEALEIIKKFVNEFDEEGEVSWNTRDEAENYLLTFKSE